VSGTKTTGDDEFRSYGVEFPFPDSALAVAATDLPQMFSKNEYFSCYRFWIYSLKSGAGISIVAIKKQKWETFGEFIKLK